MRDYTDNESMNEFIAVEIAQTAARSVDTIAQEFALATDKILNDKEVKGRPGAIALSLYDASLKSGKRTYQNFATAIDRIIARKDHEDRENQESKTTKSPTHATVNRAMNRKDEILEMYWDRKNYKEIAKEFDITQSDVDAIIRTRVPIDLIYEKYNKGMYPYRIGRLAAVVLNKDQVRRVLNMPPYGGGK